MLKFNIKEHKLEELKKYGFIEERYDDRDFYRFVGGSGAMMCLSSMINELLINTSETDDYSNSELLDVIHDLIKDGLIIKEDK